MEIDEPNLGDVKKLLNELINKIAIRDLDDIFNVTEFKFGSVLSDNNFNNFNDSIVELDEYFRTIDEIVTDEVKTFFVSNAKCDACKTRKSLFWRRVAREKIVCNDCFFEKAYLILFDDEHLNKKLKISDSSSSSSNNSKQSNSKNKNKKSLINQNSKQKTKNFVVSNRPLTRTSTNQKLSSSSSSSLVPEEIGRRSPKIINGLTETQVTGNRRNKLFKKNPPVRNEILVSKLNTSEYVFHRGFYIQVGDIVALRDKEDSQNIYFAQIRAFLSDQFGQKSAIITWLIPVDESFREIKNLKDFDPSFFELGPAEEFPRSLDCMEFVTRLDRNPLIQSDLNYFNMENKLKHDLLRHKFDLDDLARQNFKIITKKYYDKTSELRTEYEIQV